MIVNVNFSINTNEISEQELLNIVNDFQWVNALEDFDELSEIPEEIILRALEDSIYNSLTNYYNIDNFKCNEEN